MKRLKNIILNKKKTTVEIKDLDGWIYDLRYQVNGKETYYAQILKSDILGRIEHLQNEGFKILQGDIKKLKLETQNNKYECSVYAAK